MTTENPTSFPRLSLWNKGRLIGQKRALKPKDVWTNPEHAHPQGWLTTTPKVRLSGLGRTCANR
jgi:hypothetical protein